MKGHLAVILQASGILAISAGAAIYNLSLGLVSLGVGAVLFGVSIERES